MSNHISLVVVLTVLLVAAAKNSVSAIASPNSQTVDFGKVPVGVERTTSIEVAIPAEASNKKLYVVSSIPFVTAEMDQIKQSPTAKKSNSAISARRGSGSSDLPRTKRCRIKLSAQAPAGLLMGDLQLFSGITGRQVALATISITGNVIGPISSTPEILQFGNLQSGQVVSLLVRVDSQRPRLLKFLRASDVGKDLMVVAPPQEAIVLLHDKEGSTGGTSQSDSNVLDSPHPVLAPNVQPDSTIKPVFFTVQIKAGVKAGPFHEMFTVVTTSGERLVIPVIGTIATH